MRHLTKHDEDEINRILSREDEILPSSGFAVSVMDAVRREAAAPRRQSRSPGSALCPAWSPLLSQWCWFWLPVFRSWKGPQRTHGLPRPCRPWCHSSFMGMGVLNLQRSGLC